MWPTCNFYTISATHIAEWCVTVSLRRYLGWVYLIVVLWCNVWVMNISRGREKGNPVPALAYSFWKHQGGRQAYRPHSKNLPISTVHMHCRGIWDLIQVYLWQKLVIEGITRHKFLLCPASNPKPLFARLWFCHRADPYVSTIMKSFWKSPNLIVFLYPLWKYSSHYFTFRELQVFAALSTPNSTFIVCGILLFQMKSD